MKRLFNNKVFWIVVGAVVISGLVGFYVGRYYEREIPMESFERYDGLLKERPRDGLIQIPGDGIPNR